MEAVNKKTTMKALRKPNNMGIHFYKIEISEYSEIPKNRIIRARGERRAKSMNSYLEPRESRRPEKVFKLRSDFENKYHRKKKKKNI